MPAAGELNNRRDGVLAGAGSFGIGFLGKNGEDRATSTGDMAGFGTAGKTLRILGVVRAMRLSMALRASAFLICLLKQSQPLQERSLDSPRRPRTL